MPILIIFGVPKHQQTTKLIDALKQRVYGLSELNVTENDITVKFIPEDDTSVHEMIIFVVGLFDKPERTEEVRNTLAERLAACGKKFFCEAHLVECFINPFDQRNGFASICMSQKWFHYYCTYTVGVSWQFFYKEKTSQWW